MTIPASAVSVKVGATPSTYYAQYCGGTRNGGCFVQQNGGGALINRFWDIDESQVTGGTISSATPLNLVFYVTPSDFNALNVALTNNGATPLSSYTDLQAYIVKNTGVLPTFPTPTDIGSYREIYKLRNNTAPSSTGWEAGQPQSEVYSLEIKVMRITNGGGVGKFF